MGVWSGLLIAVPFSQHANLSPTPGLRSEVLVGHDRFTADRGHRVQALGGQQQSKCWRNPAGFVGAGALGARRLVMAAA
jgi:hypothetical protein